MKKLTIALALAGGMTLPCYVMAADIPPPADQQVQPSSPTSKSGAEGRPAASMFDQLDVNKDGFIDSSEVGKSSTVKANAKSMDLDGDGKISRSEWEAFEAGSARGQR